MKIVKLIGCFLSGRKMQAKLEASLLHVRKLDEESMVWFQFDQICFKCFIEAPRGPDLVHMEGEVGLYLSFYDNEPEKSCVNKKVWRPIGSGKP